MAAGDDTIPSISITTDLAPTPDQSNEHVHSPLQSGGLLSPTANSYGPPSPTHSDTSSIPPSPTLSNHSVQYPTTVQLRNNNPEETSGLTSLNLLTPNTHHRKASNATSMTDVDSTELRHVPSTATSSFTNRQGERDKDTKKKKKGKKGEEEGPQQTVHEIELAQDEAIDPTPFHFKPYQLAHMLDPKNANTLISLGGVEGLIRGLGVNPAHGLSTKSAASKKPGAGLGASHRHDSETLKGDEHHNLPEIVLTEPGGQVASPTASDDGAAFKATIEDRRRVFGENVLPVRISKTLLQLMWLALKDKVLILLSIAAVISLALGFFQDFEGTAVQSFERAKEERGVKVIRDGVEKLIDIKEVVVGDIALLDLVKSFHVMVSSYPATTKILEGVGRYVVVAVGTKSYNGRIMMGFSSNLAKVNPTVCRWRLHWLGFCDETDDNSMTVVAGSVGIHAKFVRLLDENAARTNADESQLNTVLSPELCELFNEAIAVNSTAFQDVDSESGLPVFIGSKTETALLQFASELKWKDFQETRDAADVVQMIPFSSERKSMGVVVRLPGGGYRRTSRARDGKYSDGIETKPIDELAKENISRTIIFYANQTLRTIALCYRDFTSWPPKGMEFNTEGDDLTLIGITGIEDPLRDGVRDAVLKCHRAGVTVKMCTGDNVLTARSIATQWASSPRAVSSWKAPFSAILPSRRGLKLYPGCKCSPVHRRGQESPRRNSQVDRRIVGVTGDGTNDGPALRTANVGFSMGVAGTEVAKEASDIILMDDNFSSIVKAIMWGRCVMTPSANSCNSRSLPTSLLSSSRGISAISCPASLDQYHHGHFAALALATDPATEQLLDRKPDKKTAPLFSVEMYKMILMQSIYQIVIILVFHFRGIFNSVNCRRLDNKLNIFEGMSKNMSLLVSRCSKSCPGADCFRRRRRLPSYSHWWSRMGYLARSRFCIDSMGVVTRLLPNAPFEKFFKFTRIMREPKEILPTAKPDQEGWSGAINMVRDNLSTFANIRGGRLRSSSFVIKSRSARLSQDDQHLRISSVLTMAPTLMIGAVAAGQAYLQPGSLSDPAHADPSRSSAALWEGKLQIHPETSADDPVYKQFAGRENIA
ncbi:hypothetical protein BDZ97DRAFT_1752724 [Flammula alnicola]|nr:hypothetical protein BDZ97DRAFT_1752724 [Flammula alnicola]